MTSSLLGHDIVTNEPVYIGIEALRMGLYILGSTGQGKSGLIENLSIQNIKQGLGLCLLDPHGDLTRAILARIPENREGDVILLDIADKDYPFGLNLFMCEDITDALKVQYTVDQIMHLFEKLFDVTTATPLLLQYLRNCTYLIVYNQGMTMAEIPLLLMDSAFRNRLLANVPLNSVRLFWKQYEQMRPADQIEHSAMILRRFDHFLQPLTEPIVGQSETTLNMSEVMDSRKILLVKLDMRMDAVTSMIGSTIVSLILNAAYARAALRQDKRKQFNLYADEFQNFATSDFAILLTEARKYGVATTIAHQIRGQLDEKNKDATLNVGSIVVFKISGQDASDMAAEFDCTPPPQVTTLVTDAVGFLTAQSSISNPTINEFVKKYLHKLVEKSREKIKEERTERWDKSHGRYITHVIPSPGNVLDPDILYNSFNSLVYKVMELGNANIDIPGELLHAFGCTLGFTGSLSVETMAMIGKATFPKNRDHAQIMAFRYFFNLQEDFLKRFPAYWQEHWKRMEREEPYQYKAICTPSPNWHIEHAAVSLALIHFFGERDEVLALSDSFEAHGIRQLKGYPDLFLPQLTGCTSLSSAFARIMEIWKDPAIWVTEAYEKSLDFLQELRTFLEALAKEPLVIKQGTQRTYNDMQNEIASTLANLPKYTARVKVEGGEHTIKSLAPERGISWKELQDRISRIQAQTRKNYCRPRADVEQEIAARQGPDDPGPKTKRTHTV